MNFLSQYLIAVWDTFFELSLWLMIGAFIAGALHVLIPKNFIQKHLGNRGWQSTVKAALIGIPMPLCSCSVIPTGIGLKKHGADNGAVVSFLISTPQTGVDSIAVTAGFLGWPFAIYKVFAALVMGVSGGMLTQDKKRAPFSAETPPCCSSTSPAEPKETSHEGAFPWMQNTSNGSSASSCCEPQPSALDKEPSCCGSSTPDLKTSMLAQAYNFAVNDVLHSIWRWLMIGILLSALLSSLVEPQSLKLDGMAGAFSATLLSLLISVPLYVCATASVPIAAALVEAGLPTGAVLVFLMAGPATNMATIGAVGRGLGRRALLTYLSVVVVGSAMLGLAYDLWLSERFGGLIQSSSAEHHDHHTITTTDPLAWLCAIAMALMFIKFASSDIKTITKSRHSSGAETLHEVS